MPSKARLWEEWVAETLLRDIDSASQPDPVAMIDDGGAELDTTSEFDEYRYGRGDGQYLYLLYLINEPLTDAGDIIPVYIGETCKITSRLHQHFKRIRDALPVDAWTDDGSWGSWSKYDHMAAVYDQADSDLYAWILDVDELDAGPYGFSTFRQELEAKLVGLVHSQSRFERVFANREFVPNRVVHYMGRAGPDWLVDGAEGYEPTTLRQTTAVDLTGVTKSDLWYEWVRETILRDIKSESTEEPVPLFDTEEALRVRLTDDGGLKRSAAIDERIRHEGKKCVHESGVREDSPDGLLYILYQLEGNPDSPTATDIIPRYIGKGEAYGKKNELSANFTEIAKDLNGTRSFARWGDGDYWHTGELSNTVFGTGAKKLAWADELFEQGTSTLDEQLYLWIRAWDPEKYPGPYRHPTYLAETEALLIGLAYEAYPDQLLNHSGVPDDAPVKTRKHHFEPAPE